MEEKQAFWEIKTTLEKKGFKCIGLGPFRFEGKIAVGHERAKIRLTISDLSFVDLPKVEFVDRNALSLCVIAHLESGTGLCYADRTLLRLDRFDPGGAILRVLEEAMNTINKSLAGNADEEIALEYPLYWKGQTVQILIDDPQFSGDAKVAIKDELNTKQLLLIGNNQNVPKGYEECFRAHIIYVNSNIRPSKQVVAPRDLVELEDWLASQDLSSGDNFQRVLSWLADDKLVFFSAPNGWVGCKLRLPKDLKLLSDKGNLQPTFMIDSIRKRKNKIALDLLHGKKATLDFVTTRNLQSDVSHLKGKRIALIGCGTIGSHLGRFLIQSGAGNNADLYLVDNQLLNPGNLGRHLLNFGDIGKPKASSLAVELGRFHPELNIVPINSDAKMILSRISDCDLIIDATGVESVSEELNWEAIKARIDQRQFHLLHVFMFGNGIAAQSFLNVGGDFACYRCLRPNLEQQWHDDPRKNVKTIGDVAPASCGDGPYVPYAVDAPVMAAGLALRAVLDFFSGTPGQRLRQVTVNVEEAKPPNNKSPKPVPTCPACQKLHDSI